MGATQQEAWVKELWKVLRMVDYEAINGIELKADRFWCRFEIHATLMTLEFERLRLRNEQKRQPVLIQATDWD